MTPKEFLSKYGTATASLILERAAASTLPLLPTQAQLLRELSADLESLLSAKTFASSSDIFSASEYFELLRVKDEMSDELKDAWEQIGELTAKNARLGDELEKTVTQLNTDGYVLNGLRNELLLSREKFNSKTAEIADLVRALNQVKADNDSKTDIISDLYVKCDRLEDELEEQGKELSLARSDVDEWKAECNRLNDVAFRRVEGGV